MPYNAIIFDLDNTLLDFDLCERQSILGALESCSISLDGIGEAKFLQVFESYNSHYWKRRHHLTPTELIENSYRDALTHLNIPTSGVSCLSRSYWQIFNHSGVLEPNVLELLTELAECYRLAIVTNGLAASQYSRIKAAGLERFFEMVIVSEMVGYAKPTPQIFDSTLKKLNLAASAVLYIGDSLKYDYQGAAAAGIDFCYYNRKGDNLPEGVRPKFVVEDLIELLEIAV